VKGDSNRKPVSSSHTGALAQLLSLYADTHPAEKSARLAGGIQGNNPVGQSPNLCCLPKGGGESAQGTERDASPKLSLGITIPAMSSGNQRSSLFIPDRGCALRPLPPKPSHAWAAPPPSPRWGWQLLRATAGSVPPAWARARLAGDAGAGRQQWQQDVGIKKVGTTVWENIPL